MSMHLVLQPHKEGQPPPPLPSQLPDPIITVKAYQLAELTYKPVDWYSHPQVSPFPATIYGRLDGIEYWISHESDNLTIVAFRGTVTIADILADLSIHPTFRDGKRIHSGFFTGMEAVFGAIFQVIQPRLNGTHTLVLTGHSLAGARAHTLHYYLATHALYRNIPVYSIGFGSPFWGCKQVREDLNTIGRADRFLTFANIGDPVVGILNLPATLAVVEEALQELQSWIRQLPGMGEIAGVVTSVKNFLNNVRSTDIHKHVTYEPTGMMVFYDESRTGHMVMDYNEQVEKTKLRKESFSFQAFSKHSLSSSYQSNLLYNSYTASRFPRTPVNLHKVTLYRVELVNGGNLVSLHQESDKLIPTSLDKSVSTLRSEYTPVYNELLQEMAILGRRLKRSSSTFDTYVDLKDDKPTVIHFANIWISSELKKFSQSFNALDQCRQKMQTLLEKISKQTGILAPELNQDKQTAQKRKEHYENVGAAAVLGVAGGGICHATVIAGPTAPIVILGGSAVFLTFAAFKRYKWKAVCVKADSYDLAVATACEISFAIMFIRNVRVRSEEIFEAAKMRLDMQEVEKVVNVEAWKRIRGELDQVMNEVRMVGLEESQTK
ncbi:alpha/beta-hydrolase [Rhizoclosmatium globosum]|uniref:Alpha/beta-hydrolase n=1 Tax=Rhizoclosmatium globosum TaxID=329046 RepID=A0A1Y2ACA6_9FUNG|nr:alpha/beta-hydrolase [Rhizoclosmatium globosum]|eukprot:ORY20104.1 alpha/beta-hydrolase [Rhizoclosmatium globosum]